MIKRLRRWWQIRTGRLETPFDAEVPFWAISVLIHLALIVLLAKVIMPATDDRSVNLVSEVDTSPVDLLEMTVPEIELDFMETEELSEATDEIFEAAAASSDLMIEVVADEPVIEPLALHDTGDLFSDADIFAAQAEALETVSTQGSVGHAESSAAGAVDRLAEEVLRKLEEGPTLVVWLFDQSASLQEQRGQIRQRFTQVYEQLHRLQAAGNENFTRHRDVPLLSSVYQFGRNVEALLDEPVADLDSLTDAVDRVTRDDSGIENVMTAVAKAADDFKRMSRIDRSTRNRTRNVMLIVVTDEAGDDTQRTDATIQLCRNTGTEVFVIGVPAPFGRRTTLVKWVDPDPEYDQTPQLAEVSQGPETVRPERLRLDFTGDQEDLEMMDSGFGPFHLTRLAFETGGMYFAVHPNRNVNRPVAMWRTANYSAVLTRFFDPNNMRRYRPDYVSDATYNENLKNSALRRALVGAAEFTTSGQLESPRLRFVNFDEAAFVNSVSRAQRSAAIIEPAINRLYDVLRAGEVDRSSEISPRWQAGYDLAMGRAAAAKVRAETYNAMLAMIKTRLKFDEPASADDPKNNTWVLRAAESVSTGSSQEKLANKATEYLRRVVKDHPGTPWALLAQRELETPVGWKWEQVYTRPPTEREPRMSDNDVPREPEKPRMNEMPRKLRPPPKL